MNLSIRVVGTDNDPLDQRVYCKALITHGECLLNGQSAYPTNISTFNGESLHGKSGLMVDYSLSKIKVEGSSPFFCLWNCGLWLKCLIIMELLLKVSPTNDVVS
ncbi:hypothetical protein KP509_21G006400 [Ceratopteris richardii]|uniref:Uncharacterized protein n=1 Tax=Ceratopteris richardii TaxID=49495 RepID=A0A8T2S790_CERRI|nr:hypothetical protein KP509_21G006400 [Ceratopteris richardii]